MKRSFKGANYDPPSSERKGDGDENAYENDDEAGAIVVPLNNTNGAFENPAYAGGNGDALPGTEPAGYLDVVETVEVAAKPEEQFGGFEDAGPDTEL